MWYVYILQSLKDKRTYVGYTHDIQRRLAEHNRGAVTATHARRPFVILFTQEYLTEETAKQGERYWKSGAGRRALKKYFQQCDSPALLLKGVGEARSFLNKE